MPCGREEGKNSIEEMPYEFKIRKKGIKHHFFTYFSQREQPEGYIPEKTVLLGKDIQAPLGVRESTEFRNL
jgi:hypothetical protein